MHREDEARYFREQEELKTNPQFQILNGRIQFWVLGFPLATSQFSRFFRDGGQITKDPRELLASYKEGDSVTNPPAIMVNPGYYPLVDREGNDTVEMERSLFAMLAHEVGHHTINSQTHPFVGTTREENRQYWAEHEAMTVLNAFSIFDELQQGDPTYQPDFGSVGYGFNLSMGRIYHQWHKQRDDRFVIQEVAKIVVDTEDKRTKLGYDNVPDYNHDGRHTHGERFMRDWDESEKRRQGGPATRTNDPDEARPESERTPRHQGGVQPPPPGASTRELFDYMCTAMETGDDRTFKQAMATVADAPSNHEFWAHISTSVDADVREAALQAQVREQAQQLQQMERQGPVMSLGFSR